MKDKKIDVLSRKDFIEKLVNLTQLMARTRRGCCFGINGVWGSGKSFVLEKFEKKISLLQSETTADNLFYVFHYDCWKFDYYDEPSIAIISAMLDSANRELSFFSPKTESVLKSSWVTAKKELSKIAGELCKNKIGIDLVELAEDTLKQSNDSSEKDFDSLYGFKKALEETRKGIKKIAENKTVLVVVDELDRCLPEYSIKVLERLHHIFFNLDNVIVIVSMDKKQLEHSIKGIYGEIDTDVYLRKFITFKMDLDNGTVGGYCQKFYSYFNMFFIPEQEFLKIEDFFCKILQGLDMRTQEQIFHKAEIIHSIVSDELVFESSVMAFEILFLTLALLTKTKQTNWFCDLYQNVMDQETSALGNGLPFEYCQMLKEFVNSAICSSSTRPDGTLVINPTFEGKLFFWMANMSGTYADNICQNYYFQEPVSDIVNFIHRFSEYVDIIDCD